MKKILLIFYILFICISNSYTQYYLQLTDIYDNVPLNIKSRNAFQREKWFYEQRIYPNSHILKNAYRQALEQKNNNCRLNGYYCDDVNWFSIGPTSAVNINYGNVSSRIATVKFDPLNPDIIYIGAAFGGVWKTTNGGINWNPKSDFEISLSSGALAIDNTNTNIIYIGTGEATYFTYSYYGRGLLKSTDGGETWTNYTGGLPEFTYFSRLVIKPGSSDILFAALGTAGLYKSTDAGQQWFQIISGRCDDIIFSPDGSKAYCIGEGSGYRISSDGGNTFASYNVLTPGTRNHMALCRSAQNILYASVYDGTNVTIYKSINSGYNFITLQNNFTGTNQAWYDFYIHVNPFDPDNVYVGLIDLWRTTDGSNFIKITNTSAGPVHVDHHNMDFHPSDPNKLICANDGGVYYSTNRGNNWINLNATLNLTQFYRITSDPSNASHILGGTQDNGVQQTSGSVIWNVLSFGGDGGEVCFHSKNNNIIIAENQFNRLKRTTNGGLTWSPDTNGLSGNAAWIAPILSHPDSAGIFYTARQQVFKSTNFGDSWFAYSSGTANTIREMAISKSNPLIIYVSTSINIYKSSNGGKTFSNVTSNLPNRIITSVNIHPDSSNVAMITYSGFGGGHVYRTTNYGVNWFDISGNLPDIPVNDCMFYYPGQYSGIIITATDIGVFISNNLGNSWIELAEGLPNTVCIHLDYNQAGNKLRVGTHGRGVWELNGNITEIVQSNSYIPENFILYQNFPNPFNSSTTIKFDIPLRNGKNENIFVILKIYDILGKEISVLINSYLEPGTYYTKLNSSDLGSGLYYYRIQCGEYSDIKKMILIK